MLELVLLFIGLMLWFVWKQLEAIAIALRAIWLEARYRREKPTQ